MNIDILNYLYFQNVQYAVLKSSNSDNYNGDFKFNEKTSLVSLKVNEIDELILFFILRIFPKLMTEKSGPL